MNQFSLDIKDCALLIIDLQEKLMSVMNDRDRVCHQTNLLLALCREYKIPIIVTEQYPKGLGGTVNEVRKNLNDFIYMEKVNFSACIPDMEEILTCLKKKTLIVTGCETHVCVFQTTRDLLARGYDLHVVRDAVCSRTPENYENGLDLMRSMGAVITNAETVTYDLLKKAGTPEFKNLLPLLK